MLAMNSKAFRLCEVSYNVAKNGILCLTGTLQKCIVNLSENNVNQSTDNVSPYRGYDEAPRKRHLMHFGVRL